MAGASRTSDGRRLPYASNRFRDDRGYVANVRAYRADGKHTRHEQIMLIVVHHFDSITPLHLCFVKSLVGELDSA